MYIKDIRKKVTVLVYLECCNKNTLGELQRTQVYFHNSEAGKSKVEAPSKSSWFKTAIFLLCPHTARQETAQGPFDKSINHCEASLS